MGGGAFGFTLCLVCGASGCGLYVCWLRCFRKITTKPEMLQLQVIGGTLATGAPSAIELSEKGGRARGYTVIPGIVGSLPRFYQGLGSSFLVHSGLPVGGWSKVDLSN